MIANLLGDTVDFSQIAFCECDHGSVHAEISQDLQMLFGLGHPAVVRCNNEEREIYRPHTSDHVPDEIFVAGHIDDADMELLLVGSLQNQLCEAELDGDLSRFFFGQAIGINSGERFDQRALAVIDVTGRRDDEMYFGHATF